jgi:hypothetical protein
VNDPFNRGENDRGRAYNDLGLILRDAAHIEYFRDLCRNGPPTPVVPPERMTSLDRSVAALHDAIRDDT